VSERYAAIREFIERSPEALHSVSRAIIEPGRDAGAAVAFEAQYRLRALRRQVDPILADVDFVVTLFADAISDGALARYGDRLQRVFELPRGGYGACSARGCSPGRGL